MSMDFCKLKPIHHTLKSLIGRMVHTSAEELPFRIPEKIKRSNTDILQALSDTVKVNPTAPNYSFIDDPLTIPTTLYGMKHLYTAKEMGRRTARKLAEEWPTLFMFDRDQPRLSVFRPQKPLDPDTIEPTEDNIRKMIANNHIKDAIILYKRIIAQKVQISEDTKIALFKASCYYNGNNIPINEIAEWHAYRNFASGKDVDKEWNSDNGAELIFNQVQKTPETYSILLCGLLKFLNEGSHQKVVHYFKEMLDLGFVPFEEVFNSLICQQISIKSIMEIKETDNGKFDPFKLINFMIKKGVKPSTHTYNSFLRSISNETFDAERITSVLNEMKLFSLTPNLTTYSHLLKIFMHQNTRYEAQTNKSLQRTVNILNEFLDSLEAKGQLEISETTDFEFFTNAMDIACESKNIHLVDRIEQVYSSPQNKVRIPNFFLEHNFYETFLLFKLKHSKSEEAVSLYKSLVPRVVGLHPKLMLYLLKLSQNMGSWDFTNHIVHDSISGSYFASLLISARIVAVLLSFNPESLSEQQREQHRDLILKIVTTCVQMNRNPADTTHGRPWHPQSLINSILLLLHIGETNRALLMLELLLAEESYEGGEETIISHDVYIWKPSVLRLVRSLPPASKEKFRQIFPQLSKNYNLRVVSEPPRTAQNRQKTQHHSH